METRRDGSPSGGLRKIILVGVAFFGAERFKVLKGKASCLPAPEVVVFPSAHLTDEGPPVGCRSMFGRLAAFMPALREPVAAQGSKREAHLGLSRPYL